MPWNRICLRVMLWALALSALAGVGMIFSQQYSTLGRLLGTTVATAVTAALLWPLTRWAEKPETRLGGMVGMAAMLFDFFLILILIWWGYQGRDYSEALSFTSLFVFLTAWPAVFFLLFLRVPAAWWVARVGVGVCALTFLELMVATWLHPVSHRYFSMGDERWLSAAGATAFFGLLVVACLAGSIQMRPWRWAGVLAALAGWMMFSMHFFHESHSPSGRALFTLMTTVALVVAYANLCLLPTLALIHEMVRLGTIIMAILTAVMVYLLTLEATFQLPILEGLGRLAAASGIVAACGTVAILVLALLNKTHQRKALHVLPWVEMTITCPNCGLQQKVRLGNSTCSACLMEFSIRIGEGRPLPGSTHRG